MLDRFFWTLMLWRTQVDFPKKELMVDGKVNTYICELLTYRVSGHCPVGFQCPVEIVVVESRCADPYAGMLFSRLFPNCERALHESQLGVVFFPTLTASSIGKLVAD